MKSNALHDVHFVFPTVKFPYHYKRAVMCDLNRTAFTSNHYLNTDLL